MVKKLFRALIEYVGHTTPWLARGLLVMVWPFPRLYIYVARHARLSQPVVTRTFHVHNGPLAGFDLNNLLPDEIGPVLSNSMETICSDLLVKLPLKSGVAIDIGGLYGYYALLLSRLVGANGRVYSFEPDWRSFARLSNNVVINQIQNVVPLPICVQNTPQGLAEWQSVPDEPWTSRLADSIAKIDAQIGTRTTVPITTLDHFADTLDIIDKINFVKIDVEGMEFEVLEGATQLLRQTKPIILCELHSAEIAQRVFGLLSEHGYQWEQIEYVDEARQHILAFGHGQAQACRDLIAAH